jgi:heptosyltransferase-3
MDYPNLEKVRRALVVKTRHLGDTLLASPLFSCLKEALPQAQIDALIYKESAPLLEGHPAIATLLLYDRAWKKLPFIKKIFKEIALLREIRRRSYDLAINLTEGDRGAVAAFISGAAIRVGFDPEGSGFFGKRAFYTHLVKNCPTPRHAVERNLDALRRIGIFPEEQARGLFLHVPEEALAKVRPLVPKEFVLIHPASRWKFKCLPAKTMAETICALKEQGIEVVLTSGPDAQEIEMVHEIIAQSGETVVNLAGTLTLKELAALIQLSDHLICVDSVALHIASALKTPVTAVFGPTSEQNWGPWMHPEGRVIASGKSCRPCGRDGCGGSKRSDCLQTISSSRLTYGSHQSARLLSRPQPLDGSFLHL